MTVERQRARIIAAFVVLDIVEDAFLLVGNLGRSMAVFGDNVARSLRFYQYDQARKYEDLTGGDLGIPVGCPGHFTGACPHSEGD